MYQLSHVGGKTFSKMELAQIWGEDKDVEQSRGDDAAWKRSAWQAVADLMQLSAEEVIKAMGLKWLFETGHYQMHKVHNHHLHNYLNFVFHRSDNTAVDTSQRHVRGFVTISQTKPFSNRKYIQGPFRLSDGQNVKVMIAWN